MGVTLQLIFGILLALSHSNYAKAPTLRQIREAPPPSPAPIQNVSTPEIDYRDRNKIVKDNPKTEDVNSKPKRVNIVHNYEELPLKLAISQDDDKLSNGNKNNTRDEAVETQSSKEEDRKSVAKLVKEKVRDDNFKTAGLDALKFWAPDFHTLDTTPKFEKKSNFSFEETRHPSFEANIELTTPISKLFDQKFKETVESVEQNIEDDYRETEETSEGKDNKDGDLNVKDDLKNTGDGKLEIVKIKTIVNNETVDKNSIHKDVNFEQTKKINFVNVFNDTKVYEESTTKGETSDQASTERTTSSTAAVTTTAVSLSTRKSSLPKESLSEKKKVHLLNNNIETGTSKPIKGLATSTIPTTTKGDKGELEDVVSTSSAKPNMNKQDTKTTAPTTTSTIIPTTNVSDQENHVIPLRFGSERTLGLNSSTEHPPINETTKRSVPDEVIKPRLTLDTRLGVDTTTTEIISTTEIPEGTTIFDYTTIGTFDGTSTPLPEEGTTLEVVEENITDNLDSTTEISTSTERATTESGHRTSKSLESLVTEQMLKVSERTLENVTKDIEESTVSTETTIRNELDSTTLNNGRKITSHSTDNVKEKVKDNDASTTEDVEPASTISANSETTTLKGISDGAIDNVTTTQEVTEPSETTLILGKAAVNTTEKVSKAPQTTTEAQRTTQKDRLHPTTTEYAFVHIEHAGSDHSTLLPEILSPNLNYSTTIAVDNDENVIRKVILDNSSRVVTEESSSLSTITPRSNTTTSSTTQEPPSNVSTSTEDGPTDSGLSNEPDSGNKGKIAAIAISSVGAVCLVLLAGLLYVMKKRQKRLNYGPRCRPVSLDDYSIDNLSVYNSVRRKGGARMSKRSFGNPAFDDPVAPTHPLNFPALAKFSTNFEDIKAEFEEIPQISARTSEVPDGCDTKNRYANVIPLPETRVFLKPIDGYANSDYINANYVTGPKNTKGYYIATQGPMQNTVDDFWRMIWEQQAKVILMLTHLVENGLEKCVDYLPESEVVDCSRMFGDFQITLKKQEVKDKYIISTLQLKNMVSNSWREVTHFWYLGWPEKGVPSEGNSLIAFLIEARSYMKTATIDKRDGVNGIQNGGAQSDHNPVVVHCSPGTGRTGVAIACDIAIREFETTRLVDIPKIVYKIRRDRAGAIQTKEQYTFIYKVVSLYATKLTGGALENF